MANTTGKKFGGRQKGSPNRTTKEIRNLFQQLLETNFTKLQSDLDKLKPEQRVKAILELAKFVVPTLKAIDLSTDAPPQINPINIILTE